MTRKHFVRLNKYPRTQILLLSLAVIVLALLAMLFIRLLPPTTTDVRRSACLVEGHAQLCLIAGKDTIVLHTDSVNQQGVWINKHWWWPSCDGRVLTVEQGQQPTVHGQTFKGNNLGQLLIAVSDSVRRLMERKTVERKELEYYLRSHGVQDEGYTRIAHYADLQLKETDSLQIIYGRLKAFKPKANMKLARRYLLRVAWINNDNILEQTRCKPLITNISSAGQPMIVHTLLTAKPWGVYAVRNLFWGGSDHKDIVTVTIVPRDTLTPYRALLTSGHYSRGQQHNIPRLFARNGSPVFTKHGLFVGIISNHEIKK